MKGTVLQTLGKYVMLYWHNRKVLCFEDPPLVLMASIYVKGVRAGGMTALLQLRPKLGHIQLCILAVLLISHHYIFIRIKIRILQMAKFVAVQFFLLLTD